MSINVAIIGAGNISRAHLSALHNSQRGKVVGLYDADRYLRELETGEAARVSALDGRNAVEIIQAATCRTSAVNRSNCR